MRAMHAAAVCAAGTVFLSGLSCAAGAVAPELKTGEQVYDQVCKTCHATGEHNAPRFGDRKAWARLIKEGQVTLTADGWVGVRKMPPRGGSPDLTLEEFSRAVVHMARAAGGTWKEPDARMLESIKAREKKRIESLKAKK